MLKIFFSIKMDQHLTITIQIFYGQKLQSLIYQQHTYAIIGIIHRSLTNCFQHIFINNNHWILVKMQASTINLHYTIYDSNRPIIKKLSNDTIQLLTKITNVRHLLYSYANVMRQQENSSRGLFIIAYAINITFELNPKKSVSNVPKMQSHLHNIKNNIIFLFPEYWHSNTL